MANAQNIHQKHFGDIGTKIDKKNLQFGPPLYIDPYMGVEITTWFKFLHGMSDDHASRLFHPGCDKMLN